ncbi:MAG: response regulator transcription factor [Oscillospiraceae bacterium]|nr:response regulator transcription factor [Oscillospiraceae bacterium]
MIWCIEDDASIREIEIYTLTSMGFEARGFDDGKALFEALEGDTPELIILDIMLPGEDGVELLKRLRTSPETCRIPVIMATAKGTEYDKIKSLDLGADDYLVKPFGMLEMVSRVKAVLRRCAPEPVQRLLKTGGLLLNLDAHTVTADGERVTLTFKEFELLKLFMTNPGMVFTREKLMNDVWGIEFVGESRTVDMHIRSLRKKLGEAGGLIVTVRNVGYKLE